MLRSPASGATEVMLPDLPRMFAIMAPSAPLFRRPASSTAKSISCCAGQWEISPLLRSDAAAYITGALFVCDDGQSLTGSNFATAAPE
jgi:hypothetical protein